MEEMNDNYRSNYMTYMLRLWRDGDDAPWRASLECARTGERHPFVDLSALFDFLKFETGNFASSQVEDSQPGEKSQTGDV